MCDSSGLEGPCASALLLSLDLLPPPIDDETQLDAGTQSHNIHVPDHDNNSATDGASWAAIIMLMLAGLDYNAYTVVMTGGYIHRQTYVFIFGLLFLGFIIVHP